MLCAGNIPSDSSSSYFWQSASGIIQFTDHILTVTPNNQDQSIQLTYNVRSDSILVVGHKYAAMFDCKLLDNSNFDFARVRWPFYSGSLSNLSTTNFTRYCFIGVCNSVGSDRAFGFQIRKVDKTSTSAPVIQFTNLMLFDVTDMFGSGNEPTAEQFQALYPLLYYYANY